MFRLPARAAAALLTLTLATPDAHASDGVWRVGNGYVIRFERLDLSQPTDRQILLTQVERTAEKLCDGQRPQTRRDACAAETVRSMMTSADPGVQAGFALARLERDGQMQAQR